MSWQAVGDAVENRRVNELNMTNVAVARGAGVDVSNLHKLRRGKGDELSDAMRAKLERALRWPPGTLDAIYNGAPAPTDVLTDPQRLDRVEDDVAALRDDVRALTTEVKRLLGQRS